MLDKKKLDVDEYIELVFSIGVADTEEALKKLERLKRYLPPADYEKIRANLLLRGRKLPVYGRENPPKRMRCEFFWKLPSSLNQKILL